MAAFRLLSVVADRLAGRRIAGLLEISQVAVGVAGLAFGGRAEHGGYVVIALDISLLREIQVTAVCLALAGERVLEILFGLAVFQGHEWLSSLGRCAVPGKRPPAVLDCLDSGAFGDGAGACLGRGRRAESTV